MKAGKPVTYIDLPSAYGHDAFLVEIDRLGPLIRNFYIEGMAHELATRWQRERLEEPARPNRVWRSHAATRRTPTALARRCDRCWHRGWQSGARSAAAMALCCNV